jgi:ribosome-associated heat shock protein Hsp15
MKPPVTSVRLDKWLWAVRVYKTRALATAACRKGWVEIDGHAAKASHDVRRGETIVARTDVMTRTVKAVALLEQRVGAALVANYAEDLTPASEYAKRPEPSLGPPVFRPPGAGRPTKKERRALEQFLDSEE